MLQAHEIVQIFSKSIHDYHVHDAIDAPMQNPYEANSIEAWLYQKNWIDTVQWHLEDIIRNPTISTDKFMATKRRIDASNQERTDMVEKIDEWFFQQFNTSKVQENAKLNSETPAWLLDRMSILQLKIFHFEIEKNRKDKNASEQITLTNKFNVLKEQEQDLNICFDDLIQDLQKGKKYMKLYKQMKMYNDPKLNPELYKLHG